MSGRLKAIGSRIKAAKDKLKAKRERNKLLRKNAEKKAKNMAAGEVYRTKRGSFETLYREGLPLKKKFKLTDKVALEILKERSRKAKRLKKIRKDLGA